MYRMFMIALVLPITLWTGQGHAAHDELSAFVRPPVMKVVTASSCDKRVAVFKVRNDSSTWKARALISFVDDHGVVLFQQALRMAKSQTMSYRLARLREIESVKVIIDYPGTPRIEHIMEQPCPR